MTADLWWNRNVGRESALKRLPHSSSLITTRIRRGRCRILWVVDAYTTTSNYPYAQPRENLGVNSGSGLRSGFNYVRNSAKATVDAYDGTVVLYVVDQGDPIIAAWQKVFPDLFAPIR